MSLILDALRKSDRERARQKAPQSVAAATSNGDAPAKRWLLPVIALLVLNAAFLMWLAFKPSQQDVTAQPARDVERQTVVEVAPRQQPAIPDARADVSSLLDEAIRSAAAEREQAPTAAASAPARTAAATPRASANDLALPTYTELKLNGSLTLDQLNLDLHVYSEQADARLAFINGQKVTAGTRLKGGGEVVEITEFGVILQHNGQRFVLPRD